MVLEGLVAALVQTFCSRFVKDFQKKNLLIELSGEITLSNIELKLDEFETLQLPIGPKRIHIGHLRSNVVAAQLTNQPLHIQAADVTILMGTPSSHDRPLTSTDAVADADAAHQAKIDWIRRLLTGNDDTVNTRLPGNGPPPTSGASRWLRLFLDAFVSLERVHVCVVDGASGCSAGFRLDTLLMQPATALPSNPLEATMQQQCLSKIIQVTNASLYVEEPKRRATAPASNNPTAAAPATHATTHCVVCFGAMAIALTIPRSTLQIQASVTFPPPAAVHVNASLSHLQIGSTVLHGLDSAVRASLYRRFRPISSRPVSKATARAWWQYAVFATLLQQNDPVFRRPSWAHTINLVLVGLQYTAVRRAILPYLERVPFDATKGASGYSFQHVERLRVNQVDVSALPLAMTGALDPLPSAVTHYGNAVFGGIYGWSNAKSSRLDPTDASPADAATTLRHLWSRQLYLDACFRPIIAAKLRLLANDQIRKREQAQNASRDFYNKRRGILVVTVVDCSWRDGSLHRSLLHAGLAAVHVKVGSRGKAYVGTPVPCQGPVTAPECCGCTPTHDAPPTTCIFGQSFEFRLGGTPDEDFLHISIQDEWVFPYLHQESTTATVALAACTAASHSNHDVALPQDRGRVRVATTFTSSDDHVDAADVQATALAHFNEVYPEAYAKQHTWTSWYTPTNGTVHGLRLLPTLHAVDAAVPAVQVQIQLGRTEDSAFRIHVTNVSGRYRSSITDRRIQFSVDSIECVSGGSPRAGTQAPWLHSITRPALDVVMAKPTRTLAQSTVTLGAIHVTASVPMLLLLYTTVVQWKDVALEVLTLLCAPIYGPFGVWVAPPAVTLPRTPDTITTNLHLGDLSLCVDDVGTWFAGSSKLAVVTQGNATAITNEAGRSVAKLHWDLWQSFLRRVDWAWSQPDMAGPLEAPVVDEWQRQAGHLWLAQGLSVLKHHTHRGLPQERIVWLREGALLIGKSRFKSSSRVVRELPLPEITHIVAGRSSVALARTGTAENAALYLTLVCADRPVSFEFTAVNIRQLVQRTLADLVVESRTTTN